MLCIPVCGKFKAAHYGVNISLAVTVNIPFQAVIPQHTSLWIGNKTCSARRSAAIFNNGIFIGY